MLYRVLKKQLIYIDPTTAPDIEDADELTDQEWENLAIELAYDDYLYPNYDWDTIDIIAEKVG